MSSNEPENYQFHRTQTPESPRPIYPPEPSNIPLLKNQNDPALADASTYNIRPSSQMHTVETNGAEGSGNDLAQSATGLVDNEIAPLSGGSQIHTGIDGSATQMQPFGLKTEPNQANAQASYQQYMTSSKDSSFTQSEIQSSRPLEALSNSGPSLDTSHIAFLSANPIASDPSSVPKAIQESSSLKNVENARDTLESSGKQDAAQSSGGSAEGVNYQSLLENLTRSTSAAPALDHNVAACTVLGPSNDTFASGSDMQTAPPAGLPPRPPPNADTQSISHVSASTTTSQSYPFQTSVPSYNGSLPPMPVSGNAPGTTSGSNGLPPPPGAAFLQSSGEMQQLHTGIQLLPSAHIAPEPSTAVGSEEGEHKWGQEVQRKYDQFLADERSYVTEGVWDKFPLGSRMFVGNLPTEKVTKRDLFHLFHKYGKLAQISIKQAYGFVQFLDASDCAKALEAEQGATIRGRRLHLEISKPQKNSRGSGQGDGNRQSGRKRSRSPDRRGGRRGQERLPYSDYRDEPGRRRDEYRPGKRSASPRSFRQRDDYRPRDGHRDRSRSPYSRSGGHHRSQSPVGRVNDDESVLPLPRRQPGNVPDVQIIVLDDVDRNFISYLENGIRSKGLQCESLILDSRLPLAAVVKRQIIEGVQAIIKLTRSSQYNGKIPLQVFDRSTGVEVKFNEYVDLDIGIAAEIVLQNKRNQPTYQVRVQSQYGIPAPSAGYGQIPTLPFNQAVNPQDPNVASMISNLDAPALQKLLSAMQQQGPPPSQQPTLSAAALSPQTAGSSGHGNSPDLATLLTNVARQQQQQQPPAQAVGQFPQATPQGYSAGSQPSQNMQNIMDRLAHFRR